MPTTHWNPLTTLERLDHDRSLLRVLISVFVEDVEELIKHVQSSIESCELSEAARGAHSLRGMALNFDAFIAASSAEALECECSAGHDHGARIRLPQVCHDFSELHAELLLWTD